MLIHSTCRSLYIQQTISPSSMTDTRPARSGSDHDWFLWMVFGGVVHPRGHTRRRSPVPGFGGAVWRLCETVPRHSQNAEDAGDTAEDEGDNSSRGEADFSRPVSICNIFTALKCHDDLPIRKTRWRCVLSAQVQVVLGVSRSVAGCWDAACCADVQVVLRDCEVLLEI